MFRTIKSKIIIIAAVMLAILLVAFSCFVYIFKVKTQQLMLQNYGYSINTFVQNLNKKIVRIEDNSKDLALIGSLFYKTDRSIPITNQAINKIFQNYPDSLGGGIWFEPYIVDSTKKRFCFYAYRNSADKIVLDESFASEEYDYHNQSWYKEISSEITKEHSTAWSLPYFEKQGSKKMMITVGTGIYYGDKLVGLSTVDWDLYAIFQDLSAMKPIEKSFAFFEGDKIIKDSFALLADLDEDYIIVSNDPYLNNSSLTGKSVKNIPWYNKSLNKITYFDYHNKKYVPYVKSLDNGLTLIICIPKNGMFRGINKFVSFMLMLVLFIVFVIPQMLYVALKRNIIKPINKLMHIANKISHGENVKIKIDKPEEFAMLASTFDKMTQDIKSVTKEREKINSELSIAKAIQLSSLPNVFPAFPDNTDFDIYAYMAPAKEVGGDFYDFYFIDDKNLLFLIADVSGKGVPAALFMMTVKTLISNMVQMSGPSKELIKNINKKICENNSQGFFVTMLSGVVNTKTGKVIFVNCGHNPPMIKRNGDKFEYLKMNSNIALGVFEDIDFELYETELAPGDIIFTYTDGVTEATNTQGEMFGEDKLEECMSNIDENSDVYEIINHVKNEVSNFAGAAEQSDDITMLTFKYQKSEKRRLKQYKAPASMANYRAFYTWLHNECKEFNISPELMNKIDMCAEEIYANVSFYAYNGEIGDINVLMKKSEKYVVVVFKDNGIEYNPLEKPDPDITLPPEDRPLGGLGIFMVKEMADDILYERINNRNVLALYFNINS